MPVNTYEIELAREVANTARRAYVETVEKVEKLISDEWKRLSDAGEDVEELRDLAGEIGYENGREIDEDGGEVYFWKSSGV